MNSAPYYCSYGDRNYYLSVISLFSFMLGTAAHKTWSHTMICFRWHNASTSTSWKTHQLQKFRMCMYTLALLKLLTFEHLQFLNIRRCRKPYQKYPVYSTRKSNILPLKRPFLRTFCHWWHTIIIFGLLTRKRN